MTQDFGQLRKHSEIEVEEVADKPKIYKYNGTVTGVPLFLPKIAATPIEEPAKTEPQPTNDADDKIKSQQEEKVQWGSENVGSFNPPSEAPSISEQEAKVLEALSKGDVPARPEDDGPTTDTTFVVDSGVSIEEKAKAQEAKRLESVRDKLKPHQTPRLQEGQLWLSDLCDGKLPVSGVDHVITTYKTSSWVKDSKGKWEIEVAKDNPWFHSMAMADIPDIVDEYMWQADVLECIVMGDKLNERILLSGPPGTGKTTAIHQYAAWVGQPFMRFNGKDGIEQSSFLGYNWLSGGTMEWKDGLLPIGLKLGYIICLDEVFKIPPGIQMALQSLYEKGGTLLLDEKAGSLFEKTVVPALESRLFMTDNVKGTGDSSELFAATQMQDSSTIDRFGLTTDVGYLEPEDEERMLRNRYPDANRNDLKDLVKFANLVRTGYLSGQLSLTMSPRGLIAAMDVVTYMNLRLTDAIKYSYTNKIGDDTEKEAVDQMIQAVW